MIDNTIDTIDNKNLEATRSNQRNFPQADRSNYRYSNTGYVNKYYGNKPDYKTYQPQNRSRDIFCTECQRPHHTRSSCFFHSNKDIALTNIKKYARRCILCSNKSHQVDTCETYEMKHIRKIPCKKCLDKKTINYHSEDICKE